MEIKKYIKIVLIFHAIVFSFCACDREENIDTVLSEPYPYQIFITKDSTFFYIKNYDQYGEKNELGLVKNNIKISTNYEIDPIPIIYKVYSDTIILAYYEFKSVYNCDTILYEKPFIYNILGKYKILYLRIGRFFSKETGINILIDSIFFNKENLEVDFYYKTNLIKKINQHMLFFENDKFCYFKISSFSDRDDKKIIWNYLIPEDRSLLKKYFDDVSEYFEYSKTTVSFPEDRR